MAIFPNICVNLRDSLCGVRMYASAEFLDCLDLVKNISFLDWTTLAHAETGTGILLRKLTSNARKYQVRSFARQFYSGTASCAAPLG